MTSFSKMVSKITLGLLLFMSLPAFAFDVIGDLDHIPTGSTTVIDDFEKGNYWIWAAFDFEEWGPSKLSTSARVTSQWASQGKQSLECRFIESSATSANDGMYFMDYLWNFASERYIVVDVYNPQDKPINFSVALQVTDNWNWGGLHTVVVEPGMHTVVLDLNVIKKPRDIVRRINLCYSENTKMNGHFFVDNLRLVK